MSCFALAKEIGVGVDDDTNPNGRSASRVLGNAPIAGQEKSGTGASVSLPIQQPAKGIAA